MSVRKRKETKRAIRLFFDTKLIQAHLFAESVKL